MSRFLHISVILRVIFAHGIAASLAGGAAVMMSRYFADAPPALVMALAQGVIAAALGLVFRLAWWWAPLNLAAPPLVLLVGGLGVPSWVFLVVFVMLLLVYWNSAREGVPLYLSNRATVRALATLLPAARHMSSARPLRVVDLGSGTGSVVLQLSALRHDIEVTGIETAPIPWFISKIMAVFAGGFDLDLRRQSIWDCDLGGFDVAYCFLAPPPMAALYDKARAEMKPGALLISNSFAVPGVEPTQIVEVADRRGTRLLIYEPGGGAGVSGSSAAGPAPRAAGRY